jgi:hypothetical protein
VGQVVRIPPADRDWTSWERSLFDRALVALRADGVDATRYEWLTSSEVWCSFRETNGPVVADVGRVHRFYCVRVLRGGRELHTFDLRHALQLIRRTWHLATRASARRT